MSNIEIQIRSDDYDSETISDVESLLQEQPSQEQVVYKNQGTDIDDIFASYEVAGVDASEKPIVKLRETDVWQKYASSKWYQRSLDHPTIENYLDKKHDLVRNGTDVTRKALRKAYELKEEPDDLKVNIQQTKPWIERYNEFRKKLHKVGSEPVFCTLQETKEKALKRLVYRFTDDIKKLDMNFERVNMDLVQATNKGTSRKSSDANESSDESTTISKYKYSITLKEEVKAAKVYVLPKVEPLNRATDEYKFEDVFADLNEGEKLCEVCGQSYKKGFLFHIHRAKHYDEEPFKCKVCDAGFLTLPSLRFHFNNIHAKIKARFICKVCDKGFRSELMYQRHMTAHKRPSAYFCEYCLAYFSHEVPYKQHLYKHGEGSLNMAVNQQCEVCGRIFRGINALNTHLETHTGDYSFKCSICEKGFNQKSLLKWHMDIHLEVKRFSCDVCHKKFRLHSAVNKHYNEIHLNIRPHKCIICGHNATTKRALDIHMNSHTGNTPYRCKFCPKSFKAPSSQHKHMLIHMPEKAKACPLCSKKFVHRGSFKYHMLMHYGIKRYECSLCDKKFVKKYTLTRHLEHHAKQEAKKLAKTQCGQLVVAEEESFYM